MNFNTQLRIKVNAAILGFYSSCVQFLLLGEFLKYESNISSLMGIVLFSWIFLSGAGSFMASRFGNYKDKLIFPGFILLSIAPLVSYTLIRIIPLLAGGDILILSLLVLSPVCLLNGIMFSLLSQVSGNKSTISKNYASESAGMVMAGFVNLTSTALGTDILITLIALGLLVNLSVFIISKPLIRFNNLLFPLGITTLVLTSLFFLSFTFYEISGVNPISKSVQLNILQDNSFHAQPFTNSGFILPVIAAVAILSIFLRKMNATGKSIFIAGFACMTVEILIMSPLKEYFESSRIAMGLIISIFMTGMIIGYSLKITVPQKQFRFFLWILLALSSAISGIFLFASQSTSVFIVSITGLGFLFSLLTGLLFNAGVQLQIGNLGSIVSTTYGADMMGAALGALAVFCLLPHLGIGIILLLVTGILLLTASLA